MGKKGYKSLEFILNKNASYMIKFVVCAKDEAVQEDYYQIIHNLCLENNIPFIDRRVFDYKNNSNVDLVVAISWRWLLIDFNVKVIVFHDSLLPKYRGFNPLVSCLIEGERQIGVTALIANDEMDAGNIVGQKSIDISYPIKIKDAIDLISVLYAQLLDDVLEDFCNKKLIEIPQDHNSATFSLWRNAEDYKIDWSENSSKILRLINAVGFPYNFASTIYNEQEISVLEVSEQKNVNIVNRVPGKILKIIDNKPSIVCGEGILQIEKAYYRNTDANVKFNLLRIRLQ